MSYIIALDLGTTGNRALVLNESGKVISHAYQEFKQIFPQPGWVEHDPLDIWHSTKQVLQQACEKINLNKAIGIAITNQRETSLIWNKKTGTPIHNAIVWQCRRTSARCTELQNKQRSIKTKTGLRIDPYFSATKVEWLFNTYPEIKKNNKDLYFGTIDTWILYQLTKKKQHKTDISNASRTLFFNINTCSYDQDLLDLFHIPNHILPEVLPNDGNFGTIDKSIIGKELPVLTMIGDQQAALFAQCQNEKSSLKNTYGTGLFICINTGEIKPKTNTLINTIAWQLNHQTNYALEGSIFSGGSAIQWLRDDLKLIKSAQETEEIALKAPENNTLFFVPALTGLGAPFWDPQARGLLIGLSRGCKKESIIRATLESLAYQSKAVIDEIKKCLPNTPLNTLKVDGGASENNFLMQYQANCLNMKIKRSHSKEMTAIGAASMAGLIANIWSLKTIKTRLNDNDTFIPKPDHKINKKYQKWLEAIKRTQKWI